MSEESCVTDVILCYSDVHAEFTENCYIDNRELMKMFEFLKKLKKDKKEKKEETVEKQTPQNGIYRGMYCPVCGYMEVNPDSNELPLEGFAHCSNCGELMKTGYFRLDEEGFHLAERAEVLHQDCKKKKISGGHYRVRAKGPGRRDHVAARRMFF